MKSYLLTLTLLAALTAPATAEDAKDWHVAVTTGDQEIASTLGVDVGGYAGRLFVTVGFHTPSLQASIKDRGFDVEATLNAGFGWRFDGGPLNVTPFTKVRDGAELKCRVPGGCMGTPPKLDDVEIGAGILVDFESMPRATFGVERYLGESDETRFLVGWRF